MTNFFYYEQRHLNYWLIYLSYLTVKTNLVFATWLPCFANMTEKKEKDPDPKRSIHFF